MDNISKVYARAIFEAAGSATKAREMVKELAAFGALIEGAGAHKELSMVCVSDVFAPEIRGDVVEAVARKMGLSETVFRSLRILSDAKRLSLCTNVAFALDELANSAEDIALLVVETAEALNPEEMKKIETQFSKTLKKQVQSRYRVSPRVMGGLKVSAGGKTYDGTLVTAFEKMQERLVGG